MESGRISLDTAGQVQQTQRVEPFLFRPGSQYNALVVAKNGDQVELLLGSRTLFARTQLDLAPGQALTLLLAEARPDLYLFRAVGREGAALGTLTVPVEADAILARLGIEPGTQARTVLSLLTEAEIPITQQTVAFFLRFEGMPAERLQLLTFVYSQFLNAGVNPDFALMTAISNYLATGPSMGPLADMLKKLKDRDRDERLRLLTDALVLGEGDISPDDIRELAKFLFTPAESAVAKALVPDTLADGDNPVFTAGGGSLVLERLRAQAGYADGESASGAVSGLLAQLEAVNALNALPRNDFLLELPIEISGVTTSLFIKSHREPAEAYEESQTVYMALETERLGRIETYIRKTGRTMRIDLYATDDETLRIVRDLSGESGFYANLARACDNPGIRFEAHRLAREVAVIDDLEPADNGTDGEKR